MPCRNIAKLPGSLLGSSRSIVSALLTDNQRVTLCVLGFLPVLFKYHTSSGFFKRSKVWYFRAIFILHSFLSKNHKIYMGRCPRRLPYKTIWLPYTERYGYHTEQYGHHTKQYGYHSKRKKFSFSWHSAPKETKQKITLSTIILCERRNYCKSIVLFAQSSTRRSKIFLVC